MVQKSTNLKDVELIPTVTGANTVLLQLPGSTATKHIPVGRYCESLKPLQQFNPAKYRLIEGISDETGKPYMVIGDVLDCHTFAQQVRDSKTIKVLQDEILTLTAKLASADSAMNRYADALQKAQEKVDAIKKFKELFI